MLHKCVKIMSTLNTLKLFLIILAMPILLIAELKLPYLNEALSPEVRVEDLMERMTIKEKVGQMCQYVGFNYLARSNKGMTAEPVSYTHLTLPTMYTV